MITYDEGEDGKTGKGEKSWHESHKKIHSILKSTTYYGTDPRDKRDRNTSSPLAPRNGRWWRRTRAWSDSISDASHATLVLIGEDACVPFGHFIALYQQHTQPLIPFLSFLFHGFCGVLALNSDAPCSLSGSRVSTCFRDRHVVIPSYLIHL
jgi:hypothetical protein